MKSLSYSLYSYICLKTGTERDYNMADKVKWVLALLILVFVLYGIQKVESIVTQGEVRGAEGGCSD